MWKYEHSGQVVRWRWRGLCDGSVIRQCGAELAQRNREGRRCGNMKGIVVGDVGGGERGLRSKRVG